MQRADDVAGPPALDHVTTEAQRHLVDLAGQQRLDGGETGLEGRVAVEQEASQVEVLVDGARPAKELVLDDGEVVGVDLVEHLVGEAAHPPTRGQVAERGLGELARVVQHARGRSEFVDGARDLLGRDDGGRVDAQPQGRGRDLVGEQVAQNLAARAARDGGVGQDCAQVVSAQDGLLE